MLIEKRGEKDEVLEIYQKRSKFTILVMYIVFYYAMEF